eukprot:6840023-Prymnesium_polylepis.1
MGGGQSHSLADRPPATQDTRARHPHTHECPTFGRDRKAQIAVAGGAKGWSTGLVGPAKCAGGQISLREYYLRPVEDCQFV